MNKVLSKIRLGTRGSPLALKQAEMVCAELARAAPGLTVETVIIKTSGDWKPADGEKRLSTEAGGKGQFAKEIEEALLAGDIDVAVHSMKDMPAVLPQGLMIEHMLPREDVRDAVILGPALKRHQNIDDLPQGLTMGTASVRRQAFLLSLRPDFKITPLRGNVGTRLEKLKAGQVDATMLAVAGLKRLELAHEISFIVPPEIMLPSAGQGAVGIEMREADREKLSVFNVINCAQTTLAVTAERAVIEVLDGSCHTPIGAYAILKNGTMQLRSCVAFLDGRQVYEDEISGAIETLTDARDLGLALGQRMKESVPADLFRQFAT